MSEKKRGRPRAYDPDAALDAALGLFWTRGFATTSLDDISAATGMNRPSLYAAFGNKKSIYRRSMDRYCETFIAGLQKALSAGASLEHDLVGFYRAALAVYRPDQEGTRSCAMICTATSEAVLDREIQSDLAASLDCIDALLSERFEQARKQGELDPADDPRDLGQVAGAILHSLAVRVRAGQTGFEPEAFIRTSVAAILTR